jgi:hypothetical protein
MRSRTPAGNATVPSPRGGRAFARSTLELAGLTGVMLRLYRAAVLSLDSFADWPVFVGALVLGVVVACGALTWHLSNFPLRRWPLRVAAFVGIEVAAEFGMSSVLIALHKEPLGSGLATWADWWPLAGQTLLERGVVLGAYAGLLAAATWVVTRKRPS